MRGNRFGLYGALRMIALLLFAPSACALAVPINSAPPRLSKAPGGHDLYGVWTGASITSCTPLRMDGPWRCGAKADITLTFIQEGTAGITGVYASDRDVAGNASEEGGSIVETTVKSPARLWLRVLMRDHSSCLFSSNLPENEMAGGYLCFHGGTSFERGRWWARRAY